MESVMSSTTAKLKVHIDREWDSLDFINVINSINRLHNYHLFMFNLNKRLYGLGESLNWPESLTMLPEYQSIRREVITNVEFIFESKLVSDKWTRTLIAQELYLFANLSLEIKKIQFGSKGNIDFLGIGEAFKSIKEIVFHYLPNSETKTNIKLKQTEIELKQQDILAKKIENLKNLDFKAIEIQKLIGYEYNHIDKLLALKEKGQIIDIEILDE